MKGYKVEKVVDYILNEDRMKTFSNYAEGRVHKKVRVFAENSDGCYSSEDYRTGTMIALGKRFYESAWFDCPSVIPYADVKTKYKHIVTNYYGAYFHELFHLLYTLFGEASKYLSDCNPNFQQFAHQICNILEDQTIEKAGVQAYPSSKVYIDETSKIFHQPKMLELLEQAITNEPESAATLMSYLLSYVRGVDLSTLPTYKLWDDNKEFLEWGAYKCIHIKEAALRVKCQVSYALQLARILNHDPYKKEEVEDGDTSNMDSKSAGLGGDGGREGIGSKVLAPMNKMSNTSRQTWRQPSNGEPEKAEISEAKEATQMIQAQHEAIDPDAIPTSNMDLTAAGISVLASDTPIVNQPHWAADLSDYMDMSSYLDSYNDIVRHHENEIIDVVNQIKKMKALNNSSWRHYKTNGKLDMSTFFKKDNYKVFKKINAPKQEADLVISLLVDNSGSMCGNKTKLAGRALIIFCEALHRLHIPFSVDAFTEGSQSITISLKHFEESYDKRKTNMCIISNEVYCRELATFMGNVDEANVKYVAQKLSEQRQKDKILIVISDGATCGSADTLRTLAKSIERSGIMVLGIGIYDRNVEQIYDKHIILQKPEDLEKLSVFLNKYLMNSIFKGGN